MKLPDPTQPYAKFMYDLLIHGGSTNLEDYQAAGGASNGRLWAVTTATHMGQGIEDDIVTVGTTERRGETVHAWEIKPEARAFWQNGVEEGLSADDLLAGWKAMVSLTKDDSEDDDN